MQPLLNPPRRYEVLAVLAALAVPEPLKHRLASVRRPLPPWELRFDALAPWHRRWGSSSVEAMVKAPLPRRDGGGSIAERSVLSNAMNGGGGRARMDAIIGYAAFLIVSFMGFVHEHLDSHWSPLQLHLTLPIPACFVSILPSDFPDLEALEANAKSALEFAAAVFGEAEHGGIYGRGSDLRQVRDKNPMVDLPGSAISANSFIVALVTSGEHSLQRRRRQCGVPRRRRGRYGQLRAELQSTLPGPQQ